MLSALIYRQETCIIDNMIKFLPKQNISPKVCTSNKINVKGKVD